MPSSQETLGLLFRNVCIETNHYTRVDQLLLSWTKTLSFSGSPDYSHIRHQFWILFSRVAVGIGRYSKDRRAFYLFQHFLLSCCFWLFRPAALRQRFFVFCFLGQVVLGGFAKRNSIDNQCPGNKHFLLNFWVLRIWEALATLQRYSVSPAEMLILLCSLSPRHPPRPCTNHSIKDTPLLFLPLSLATCHFLPYPLPKKGNHKYWFLFSFSLKISLDSVHTTSSDVKGDGESLESRSG